MTKREMLTAIVNGDINEEVIAFAENEITKLDAANAKARERKNEKDEAKDNEAIEVAKTFLNAENGLTATMVKDAMVEAGFERADEKAVNTQFVSAVLRRAVKLGAATAEDVKITGKGVQKAYKLA